MFNLKSQILRNILCLLVLTFSVLNTNAATIPEKKAEAAQMVVRRLYQNYAWVVSAKSHQGRTDLIAESENVLGRYFTDDLAKRIRKDSECARKSSAICNLDFDLIYASQDPQISNLRILGPDQEWSILVLFRYPSTGQKIQVQYKMELVNRGWRIKDICYEGKKCLRQILATPIK